MIRIILLLVISIMLIGCSSNEGDVTTNDAEEKEETVKSGTLDNSEFLDLLDFDIYIPEDAHLTELDNGEVNVQAYFRIENADYKEVYEDYMEVLGDDVEAFAERYEEEDRGRIAAFIDGDGVNHVIIDITPVGEDVEVMYDKDHPLE